MLQNPDQYSVCKLNGNLNYITFQFVPSPNTIYADIKKLNPSNYLIYNLNNKTINRNYFLWHLQDSIGKKELVKSIDIYDSLVYNGNNLTLIYIYIFSLFEAIYNYKTSFNETPFNFALNKIIKNRISSYALKFNIKEIERIILKINENDYLIKSTNFDIINLTRCMISNICKGYYE